MRCGRTPFQRFLRDCRGVAATEFLLVAPILIVLIFTGFTVFQLVRAAYVAEKSTFTVADLMSRQLEANDALLGQMKSTFARLAQNDIGEPQLRISSIIREAKGFTVGWSYNSGKGTLSTRALPLADLPDIAVNDSILLTESIVSVRPVLDIVSITPEGLMTFEHTAVMRPRFVGRLKKTD
jgi:Flp pilus assembly protein TadG